MTRLQKITLALVLALGVASLLPLPAWADWGLGTGQCPTPLGAGDQSNCFTSGSYHVSCTWTCVPTNGPAFVPINIKCKLVPGC